MGTKLQAAAAKKTAAAGDEAKKESPDNEKPKTPSTAVATALPNANALVTAGIDLEGDSGMGMEGADKDSFALPFIAILQGLSPQLETVDDAKPGRFINTVTNEVFVDGFRFVPVAFQRRYNRWLPRSAGGGFKGTMTVAEVEQVIASGEAKEVKEMVEGKERTSLMFEGTQLKDTRNHFVLQLRDDGSYAPGLISLSSTQIKRSKRLMSLIDGLKKTGAKGVFTPPAFASIFAATSEDESNADGKWKSWVFEREGDVTDPALYKAAKEFHALVGSGAVVVAPPIDDSAVVGEAGGSKGF